MATPDASPRTAPAGLRGTSFRLRGFGIDRLFESGVSGLALAPIAVLGVLIALLVSDAYPAIVRYGAGFLVTTTWDPVKEQFGAAIFIFGTIVTSSIGLLIAMPIAIGAAVYLSDYAPPRVQDVLSFLIELLAAIPSVIYGLWGFFVLAPFMRFNVDPLLKAALSPVPALGALVEGPIIGKDILTAGVILAIMIVPTIQAVSREVIRAVPQAQREAMYGLGATRWETIRYAVLPAAWPGIMAASLLGLARALGETMAVTMVIGNSAKRISASLFTPGYTISSAIANQFVEADKEIFFSAIVELALVLLLVAALMNLLARFIIRRVSSGPGGAP
jgi:phosphate transport system permease protein